LRKPLIAAGAAALAVATAGAAYAQGVAPAPTSTAKISPSKAGTKKKPKAISLTVAVKNNDESKTTAKAIVITLPSTIKFSTKGLKECKGSDQTLLAAGPLTKCKSSKAGSGNAHAFLNPYSATPAALDFKVTPLVGHNEVLYYLEQTNGGVKTLLHGKVKGSKMTIAITPELQQPAPGVYSALRDLTTTLKATKGKHSLLSSTGCKSKKQKIGIEVDYTPNPTAPLKSSATAPAEAACS
jgi:hypothetical protein